MLERGRKVKNEGYLCTDPIFTKCTRNALTMKAKCSASKKKIKRDIVVTIPRKTSKVEKAKCSCLGGASCYCNHMIAVLFEIADYFLKGLTEVPQEVSFTSQARNYGIPGESDPFKEPIISFANKKRINPTLYDP